MTEEFNKWWNEDLLTEDNPYVEGTAAYWAWEGWCAAVKVEREACAKVCDEQVERSLAAAEKTKRTTDHRIYRAAAQTATWNAAAIRARSCPPCNNDCEQGRNCPARKDK